MKKSNKKGFTLAELLVVIAIIVILISIAVPVFSAQLDKARVAADSSNARAASSIAESDYLLNHANDAFTADQNYLIYTFGVDESGNLVMSSLKTNSTDTAGGTDYTENVPDGTVVAGKTIAAQSKKLKDSGVGLTVSIDTSTGKIVTNSWLAALNS